MGRMAPDERRDAIVRAALAVMLRNGIGATTARDVAAQLDVSSGLIHHYFASMDELVAQAFERAAQADLEASERAMARAHDPVGQLAWFLASYSRHDETWAMQLWLDAWAEAARRPALQATSQRLNEAWQQRLRQVIEAGVRQGTLTCADPNATAWRLLSLLDGLSLQTVAHPRSFTGAEALCWSRELIERELGLPSGALVADLR